MSDVTSRPLAIMLALVLAVATAVVGVSAASPASAVEPGRISGTVTGADAPGGLVGLSVMFFSSGDLSFQGSTTTGAGGNYLSPELAPGNYAVMFVPENSASALHKYIYEFYNDAYTIPSATVVFVVAGSTTTGRNSQLAVGARLSGTVTGQTGPHTSTEWTVFLENQTDSKFSRQIGIPSDGKWTIDGVAPGTYTLEYEDLGFLGDPALQYRTMWHNQKLAPADSTIITVTGSTPKTFTAKMSIAGPIPVLRISGASRYETAAEVSRRNYLPQNFDSTKYVYVANGQNYPDALSASAAAAHRQAPLLLTSPTGLPADVRAELVRLQSKNVIIVGGTGAISAAVFTQIAAITNKDTVTRVSGADRYATSRAIIANAWNAQTAANAFVATGLNYPDALAAAAAAGKVGGPVILVKGTDATADAATKALLGTLSTTHVYVAGGSAVVSDGIKASIDALPGVAVTRLGGVDRYDTSFKINNAIFPGTVIGAFMATGTGYADALAGAALAGNLQVPLFTVKPTCVPVPVLHKLATSSADTVILLGGTGALTANVAALGNCPYVPVGH